MSVTASVHSGPLLPRLWSRKPAARNAAAADAFARFAIS